MMLYSPLFKLSVFNTQSSFIGRLTQAWASTANSNRSAALKQFLRATLAASVTQWRGVMSQSHRIKGGTAEEAFQELLLVRTFYL